MREILFRGKRVANGEWVEGAFYAFYDYKRTIVQILTDRTNGIPDAYEVIPETVGQYTGLEDKNGKKIFEGDLLEDKGDIHRVYFNTNLACFEWANINGTWLDCFCGFANDYKIIGNIHDNPELLKGGESK